MTSNPITFLLGAGASFPFGIPMMVGFYTDFRDYLARRHPPCFSFLERLESSSGNSSRDLETLLSDLNAIVTLERGLTLLGESMTTHQRDVETARELRGYLDAFIVDTCERFDRHSAARELKPLLALREVGPLWLFTTNYDRIVEHACDQHSVSWADGFEFPNGGAVADWTGRFDSDVRVVKLHGSVNWYVDDPDGSLHRLDRGYSLPAYDFHLVRRDQQLRPLMIIPALEKEALGPPYVELSVRFTDVLKDARVLVIAGNSLRDRHIRDYIRARLATLSVILVSPFATRSRPAIGAGGHVHTIDAGFSEFLAVGGAKFIDLARTLAELPPADEANARAVEAFVISISQDALDETSIGKDSDLYRLWTASSALSTIDRVQAVRQLASHRHPAVTRRLESLLRQDPEPHVRIACVSALIQLQGPSAVPMLGSALLEEVSTAVQLELALALVRFSEQAADVLSRALSRPELSSVARSVIAERSPKA